MQSSHLEFIGRGPPCAFIIFLLPSTHHLCMNECMRELFHQETTFIPILDHHSICSLSLSPSLPLSLSLSNTMLSITYTHFHFSEHLKIMNATGKPIN